MTVKRELRRLAFGTAAIAGVALSLTLGIRPETFGMSTVDLTKKAPMEVWQMEAATVSFKDATRVLPSAAVADGSSNGYYGGIQFTAGTSSPVRSTGYMTVGGNMGFALK